MSINGISNPFFPALAVANIQAQLTSLQTQLGTGEKSTTYSGIGGGRGLAVSLQSQIASLANYDSVISTTNVRLTSAQQALTAIATSADTVQTSALNSKYTLDQTGQTPDQETAYGQLQQVLDALNTQVGNTYIFSGTNANSPSVASANQILNGNGAQAGLKQIISERAQADLGANGLRRLVVPAPSASPADLVGTGATLSPDAVASTTGSQDLSGLSSTGGTLVINGQPITVAAGDNAQAVVADINGQTATTGVTASLDQNNHLLLKGADATTAVAIGAGSSAAELSDLGLSAGTQNPVNLVTQGAVANNDQLIISVGSSPALTVTFGTGAGQISTLQGLNTALQGLAGGSASLDSSGDISVTANNGTDQITTAFTGTGPISNFGIAAGVTAPTAGTRVSVSEDVAGSVFGMKLAGVTSNLTGATVTGPGGSPAGITVDLGANPNAGDNLTYTFNLPDGTTQSLILTATASSPPGTNKFTIGATPAATAANLQAALTSGIKTVASTSLTAASAVAASNNFFDTDAADPPQRVAGPPFSSATSLVDGTSQNTVSWYLGEAGSTPARSTAGAQVDPSLSVSYGMRANEPALRTAVQNIAMFAAMSFSASDPNGSATYAALSQRVNQNMNVPNGSQGISNIEADIASAQSTMTTVSATHAQTSTALDDMLQNITGVDTNTVGSQILDLQTRLQASLEITGQLAQMTLVNYLPAP